MLLDCAYIYIFVVVKHCIIFAAQTLLLVSSSVACRLILSSLLHTLIGVGGSQLVSSMHKCILSHSKTYTYQNNIHHL